MGGLSGFPFVGKTGFSAYMHHVAEGGAMVIVCCSHVGINDDGVVGNIKRNGMNVDSSACGAAVAAYGYCEMHKDQLEKIANGDAS
jgi:hypothetical protein